jgi:hypothetical protein
MAPPRPNKARGFPRKPVRVEATPMAPPRPNEARGFPGKPVRVEAKPMAPTVPKRSSWFPMHTHPRRTQCGVGADERFVTGVEYAGARIPDAPLW